MEAIFYIGITQTVFAAFLIISKKQKPVSNKILFIWLIFIAIQLTCGLMKTLHFEAVITRFLFIFIFPLTYGPFLYIYTKMIISQKQVFKNIYWLHFIPFIILSLIPLIYFSRMPIPDFTQIRDMPPPGTPPEPPLVLKLVGLSVVLSLLFYLSIVWKLLNEHKKNIYEHFSSIQDKINLKWLKTITMVFTLTFISSVIFIIFQVQVEIFIFNPENLHFAGITLFAFTISYFGFRQPVIFEPEIIEEDKIIIGLQNDNLKNEKANKYERSGLKDNDAEAYLETILEYMTDEKPYLQNDLSLFDLSKKINIPRHYITQILSEKLNKNFFTFINEYRLDEFKRKINDPSNSHFTILSLAFESGFNSKACFYSAFKKVEKITPTKYRDHILSGK